MSVQAPLSQYEQVSVQEAVNGASPHRLIQMLMEGALKRMAEAKAAMQRQDLTAKGVALGKAISIIGGLRDSLNMEVSGGLSQRLDGLYEYMVTVLVRANANNNAANIDEVINLMLTVKSGWDKIADQADKQAP